MIVISSTNDIITVRGEQAGKPINYSDPALGNSTDCSSVDNYKDNDKDNVKLKDQYIMTGVSGGVMEKLINRWID